MGCGEPAALRAGRLDRLPQARVRGEGIGAVVFWLARIALLSAGLFALAILFQTLATLIVPSCAR